MTSTRTHDSGLIARNGITRNGAAVTMRSLDGQRFYAACPLQLSGCGHLSEYVSSEDAARQLMDAHAAGCQREGSRQ